LGPHHSRPRDDVFQYLKPATAEQLLVQAMLDAPMFGTRWRWNATRALAVLRARGGKKVPTPLQRMEAEDLVAAIFPDQLACPENLVGDREIPDHPLVQQTIQDCLREAMDFPGLKRVLEEMEAGRCQLVARDTTEPSPLSHEVINAKPYAFLDDAPLEERRTQAVITRRGLDVKTAEELGRLDQAAIERVCEEAWPEVASADELHDALLVMGALPNAEVGTRNAEQRSYFEELVKAGRAGLLLHEPRLCVAAERLPMLESAFPGVQCEPAVVAPERDRAKTWTREDALRELVRGRLEVVGPTTAEGIGAALGVPQSDVDFALGALEHEAGGRMGERRAPRAAGRVRPAVARRPVSLGGNRLGKIESNAERGRWHAEQEVGADTDDDRGAVQKGAGSDLAVPDAAAGFRRSPALTLGPCHRRGAGRPRRLVLRRSGERDRAAPDRGRKGAGRAGRVGTRDGGQFRRPAGAARAIRPPPAGGWFSAPGQGGAVRRGNGGAVVARAEPRVPPRGPGRRSRGVAAAAPLRRRVP